MNMPALQTMRLWYARDYSVDACLFQFVRVRPSPCVAGQADDILAFTTKSTATSQEELPQLTLYSTWLIPSAAFSTARLASVWTDVADKLCGPRWIHDGSMHRAVRLAVRTELWTTDLTDGHSLVLCNLVQPYGTTLDRSSLYEILYERNEGLPTM